MNSTRNSKGLLFYMLFIAVIYLGILALLWSRNPKPNLTPFWYLGIGVLFILYQVYKMYRKERYEQRLVRLENELFEKWNVN